MSKTIAENLKEATSKLAKFSPTPRLDAEVILANILGLEKSYLYTEGKTSLTPAQVKKVDEAIRRRAQGEPVAYIMGHKDFLDLKLKVNKRVLIPRPETEQIVLRAKELIKKYPTLPVYDVGTGSGAIAIALSQSTGKKIIASDICKLALSVAKQNVMTNGAPVELICADLDEHIRKPGILIANLPYLPNKLRGKENLKFEPAKALFAGEDGLDFYRQLFNQAKFHLAIIELGSNQYETMAEYLKELYPKITVKPVRDLAGEVCGLEASLGDGE